MDPEFVEMVICSLSDDVLSWWEHLQHVIKINQGLNWKKKSWRNFRKIILWRLSLWKCCLEYALRQELCCQMRNGCSNIISSRRIPSSNMTTRLTLLKIIYQWQGTRFEDESFSKEENMIYILYEMLQPNHEVS